MTDPRRHARSYLVTGASSGIGLEIVRLLADRKHSVVATGRRDASGLPAHFPDVPYLSADMADAAQRHQLLLQLPPELDRAILCCGAGFYRSISQETAADIQRIVEVNVVAAIHLAHGLFPRLRECRGRLGLVGSVARRGTARMPVYAASKAALHGLARSLSIEWSGIVDVKVLDPGPTATGMSVAAGRPADWLNRLMLSPAAVAHGIIETLEEGGTFSRTISYVHVARRKLFGCAA